MPVAIGGCSAMTPSTADAVPSPARMHPRKSGRFPREIISLPLPGPRERWGPFISDRNDDTLCSQPGRHTKVGLSHRIGNSIRPGHRGRWHGLCRVRRLQTCMRSIRTAPLRWAFPTGYAIESSPALGKDGTIYVGSTDYNLYAINPDGTQQWVFHTGNMI